MSEDNEPELDGPEDFYELKDKDDDPYYTAVGRIASAWARFEYMIDEAIWVQASFDEESGACVTAQLVGAASRLRAYIALVQLRDGISKETVTALNKFYQDTESLTRVRNRTVHDSWVWSSKTYLRGQMRVTADKKLDMRMHPKSLEELGHIHIAILKHRERFAALSRKVGDEHHEAWRKKQL